MSNKQKNKLRNIESHIIEIRGQKVILDSDVATMYEVETKRINEAVKRNPEKFPEGYILELDNQEWELLKSQNATSKGGKVKPPKAFTDNQKREAYEKQEGICVVCENPFDIKEMEADHIIPWHRGGKTIAENCQMLCKDDNSRKSGR